MNKFDIKLLISKLRYKVFKDFPFYSSLVLFPIQIIKDNSNNIWWATDGKFIYVNENLAKEFSFEENLFAFLHELKHLMLLHVEIAKKLSDRDKFLLNVAQDVIINELTRNELYMSDRLKNISITKEKFIELQNVNVLKLTHLEIYDILFKKYNKILQKIFNNLNIQNNNNNISSSNNNFNQNSNNNSNCNIGNNSQNSQSQNNSISNSNQTYSNQNNNISNNIEDLIKNFEKSFKQFEKLLEKLEKNGEISEEEKQIFKQAFKDYYFQKSFEKLSEKEKEEMRKKIEEAIMNGLIKAKERGLENVGLESFIENIFKKVRDWKTILREEVLEIIKGDFTWNKISDILQSLHSAGFKEVGNLPSLDDDYLLNVYIGIDVSGSISDEEYRDFLNEVYSIFKTFGNKIKGEIVLWDTEIEKVIKLSNGFNVSKILNELKNRKGYGGTTLRSFLKYCEKRGHNKILIILTDGEFESDLTKQDFVKFKKVIFVISKEGHTNYIPKSFNIKVIKIR